MDAPYSARKRAKLSTYNKLYGTGYTTNRHTVKEDIVEPCSKSKIQITFYCTSSPINRFAALVFGRLLYGIQILVASREGCAARRKGDPC